MKISKIAVAALFAAGMLASSATAVMADEKPEVAACAEGFYSVESSDGSYSCEEIVAVDENVDPNDVKPVDSCWTTEDGTDVCARSLMVPMPATLDVMDVDTSDCSVTTDDQGVSSEVCMKAFPFSGTPEEDEGVGYVDDAPVDEELMYQSGVTKTLATPADPTVSNAVAIFAVLAGALWALVIVMNRRKEAK
jgi:hypothetical protein